MNVSFPADPFAEAMRSLAARNVLPTSLSSAELRDLGGAFHRQNFTSAQTLITDLLDRYKDRIGGILNPVPAGGETTTQFNPAAVRQDIKELLRETGYSPDAGERGTIKDLSSDARINLVIQTNRDLAQGAGWFIQGNDPDALAAFPAQELIRVEGRKVPRDWHDRWERALAAAGDTRGIAAFQKSGRMVARKDSEVWQALGDGAGGFEDTLGNPFPPFAFNSGMDVRDVSYSQALALGLIEKGEQVASSLPDDLAKLFAGN